MNTLRLRGYRPPVKRGPPSAGRERPRRERQPALETVR